MKKIFLIFAAALLFAACSNEQKFQITGTLTDFGNPDEATMLYLKTRNAAEELVNLDSTYLEKDGSFALKGNSSETDLYFLADRDNVFIMRIFIDPGNKIKITGSVMDYQIKGSESQKLYDSYLSLLRGFQNEQSAIEEEYYAFLQDESFSEEEFQKIDEELEAKYMKLDEEIKIMTQEFIGANSNSFVAAYLVYRNTATEGKSDEIEQQLQLLNSDMNNKFVTSIQERLEKVKLTEVGAVMPEIELPDADGNLISIYSLRGKYVLIDFWASWCRPCIGEIPNLKKAYQKYHDKDFEIYSISLDDERGSWINGIEQFELNWINVSDLQAFNSPIVKQLAVAYVPHTFLLAPNGVILAVDLRGEELENRLAEVMP